MTNCQVCRRPAELFLCTDCTDTLRDMLEQLPWLLDQLDDRVRQLARTTTGTIGRASRPDELNIIDFDALALAREIRAKLLALVTDLARTQSGRQPPALRAAATRDLAAWLWAKTHHIARDPNAARYHNAIKTLVGDGQRGGQLVRAINATDLHLVGPCPTTTGRDHTGTPTTCGHMLFADTYDRTTTCTACGQDIDVQATRGRAAADRDLHTTAGIVELLGNIGELITLDQLHHWIRARRLRREAWLHNGAPTAYRLTDDDQPLYSVDRARQLRRRDNTLRTRTITRVTR